MIFLIAAFALTGQFGCKNGTSSILHPTDETYQPKGGMTDLVHNPVRVDGSIDSSYLPIITWKEDVFEYGTVYEGDIVNKDFYFKNTGTAPLLILNATSTCGCTIPEWPKRPIPPDSTSFIKVKFNTLHKQGSQTKEVTIFANTFPNQSKIALKGRVEKAN